MQVIGFFQNVFNVIPELMRFVTTPLGELLNLEIDFIKDFSILQLFGVSLVGFLTTLLVIHLVRLFIGG